MPPAPRPPDAARRSERARTAVLEAALALTAERPYPQVTVEAVAARAGVSKATIYRWWPSRGAVVVDALAHRARTGGDHALPDTGELEADLALVLRAIVDELADETWSSLLRALTVETLLDEGLRGQVLETIFAPQLEAFGARFAAARAVGQVGEGVGDLEALELVVAPVFHRWQQGSGPLTHSYADGVAARACRALAPA
ncbi:TetR/AcrR family transcriptional regulator [Nocardioides nanhaiensis]|uniref:TetR/AcrR family transcriptional regulator n=1 Tax=Nocardioides nanhaiensis TaxID=1476871 RepID=A0ABP8VRF5_9ACTN